MSNVQLHTWFPKTLYVVDQLMPINEVDKLETCVKSVFEQYGYSNTNMLSVRSLHRTYDKLHTEPDFNTFNTMLMEHVIKFANELGYDSTVTDKFYFKNMWSNISHEGDFNFPHVHAESLISGAYYIKAPAGAKITFFNGIQSMMVRPTTNNVLNFEYCEYDCIKNNLILFKSDFLHGNGKQPDGEKIVISFNIGVRD